MHTKTHTKYIVYNNISQCSDSSRGSRKSTKVVVTGGGGAEGGTAISIGSWCCWRLIKLSFRCCSFGPMEFLHFLESFTRSAK